MKLNKRLIKGILGLLLASIFCLTDASAEVKAVNIIPYFAYGSNMDGEDLAQWCAKNGYDPITIDSVTPAVLERYKLVFNHYSKSRDGGAANIVASRMDKVYGLLYFLRAEDREKIRKKEGYPKVYDEITVSVTTHDGRVVKDVLTYKLLQQREKPEHQPPTRYYLAMIIDNAKKYNFSSDYIGYLESLKTKD